MVKFAVMTFMYNRWVNSENGSDEELIQILTDSGAEGIEAFCNPFMGNDALLKCYRAKMSEVGIRMPVMDLISNLACADKAGREQEYEKMRMGIDICDALDTEVVHVAGCRLEDGQDAGEGRKLIADGLSAFVDDVEKRGMTLAFEDFDPSPALICSLVDCLEILDLADDRVRFVFDTGNFEACDEHAEDNFTRLIDKTSHFHFKDFALNDSPRGYGGTHFGQGMIKNRQIAQMIKDAGYNGWVALESYLQGDNGPRETIPIELNVLKSFF